MNIFVLNKCPFKSAQLMCDKHVVKMVLESAQLLSTAHHFHQSPIIAYKPTHAKHPCTLWTQNTDKNYHWLFYHWIGLMNEYTYRYNKVHSCAYLINELYINPCTKGPLEKFALAMPDEHKVYEDPIDCYHSYYNSKPPFITKYTKRDVPFFLSDYLDPNIEKPINENK